MPTEFKSFFKNVGGNEGSKCKYSTRLDTYGRGCSHDCSYCYAKSLLDFRGLWNPKDPGVANVEKVRNKIRKPPSGTPALRLGGMVDCFQPVEEEDRVTYETIKACNKYGQPYLIVSKSDLVARDDYLKIMDGELAHIQITVTTTDDALARTYEKATEPTYRIKAIEKLQKLGYDVTLRLSPYIPEYIDINALNRVGCDKILVEFLRVNTWIKKWFTGIDYSKYTVKQSGYWHLPLDLKKEYIARLSGFHEFSICEDETEAYDFWKNNVNPNPCDCCDLRGITRKE